MKSVLIVIGVLAGAYAGVGAFQLLRTLMTENAGTAQGGSLIAASFAPPLVGLIVCIVCLQKAFGKTKSKP